MTYRTPQLNFTQFWAEVFVPRAFEVELYIRRSGSTQPSIACSGARAETRATQSFLWSQKTKGDSGVWLGPCTGWRLRRVTEVNASRSGEFRPKPNTNCH